MLTSDGEKAGNLKKPLYFRLLEVCSAPWQQDAVGVGISVEEPRSLKKVQSFQLPETRIHFNNACE